jgi:hypothetical protein
LIFAFVAQGEKIFPLSFFYLSHIQNFLQPRVRSKRNELTSVLDKNNSQLDPEFIREGIILLAGAIFNIFKIPYPKLTLFSYIHLNVANYYTVFLR